MEKAIVLIVCFSQLCILCLSHTFLKRLLTNSIKAHRALNLSYLDLFTADESSYICENPEKTPKLKSINKESDTVSGGKIFSTNKKPS